MFATRKSDNKKWQKMPQLYRGRFFYLRHVVHAALGIFCLVLVISLYLYFEKSDTLFVKRIDVSGRLTHVSKNDVIKLSQVRPTDRLFSLDLGEVRKKISAHPWIENVKLRREFPETLQIDVTEFVPEVLVDVGGILYYADRRGKIFKKVDDGDVRDFPIVTGFEKDFVERYPQISKDHLKNTLAFYLGIKDQAFYRERPISEIRHDTVMGYTVFTARDGLEIYYGRSGWERKQRKLEKWALSRHFDSNRFVRVDLDGRNKIVAREL